VYLLLTGDERRRLDVDHSYEFDGRHVNHFSSYDHHDGHEQHDQYDVRDWYRWHRRQHVSAG